MINKIKALANKNKFFERIIYIAYRICALFYSFLFLICRIFPIKQNKIVACNMKGKRYGDNPKYIFDEIIQQGLNYELVWLIKDNIVADMPKEVKRASYNPFSIAYHLSTAKIWIDSNTKMMGTLKRKGQYYIQTWHGSYGLKKAGCDIKNGNTLMESKPYTYNAKIEDLMVSNSRKTTEIFRSAFRYNGKILECGSPRNDLFFKDPVSYKEKVTQEFSIQGKRIVLYAPTFRRNFDTNCMRMDFETVIKAFEQRFEGEWVVLIRMHPLNIKDAERFIQYSDKIINATSYNVMQELLVASDALITDYSSCMFDFVTTGKPCFLYTADYKNYKKDWGFYFNIMDLPFPDACNMDKMVQNIIRFDENIYETKLQKLFKQVGLCDKGNACKEVVKYVKHVIGNSYGG